MAIRKMKAMTPGTRHMSRMVNKELDQVRPEKSLTVPLKSAYGRDNYGHRTGRNREKGHKRLYRNDHFFQWRTPRRPLLRARAIGPDANACTMSLPPAESPSGARGPLTHIVIRLGSNL